MKVGIISQVLLPGYVALLPELAISMLAHIVASTGIDTLCHLLECSITTVANPVSDNAALTGLSKLFRHIQSVVNDPQSLRAKPEVLWASYYDGVAIIRTGTHPVHALSYPLGGKYHLPYDATNAIPLTPCMTSTRPQTVEKPARIWNCVPNVGTALSAEEKSHALVTQLRALVDQLRLPNNLAVLGIPSGGIASLSEAAPNVKHLVSDVPCQANLWDVQAICQTLFPQHPFKK